MVHNIDDINNWKMSHGPWDMVVISVEYRHIFSTILKGMKIKNLELTSKNFFQYLTTT